MRKILRNAVLAAGLLAVSGAAWAQQRVSVAWTTTVHAGPGTGYPAVDRVYVGQQLSLYGCLSDYAWCDVRTAYGRGWVQAADLQVYRGSTRYRLVDSQSWYQYPTLTFIFNDYWRVHYQQRPWYHNRSQYERWDWRSHNRDHRWDRRDDRYDHRDGRRDDRYDNRDGRRDDRYDNRDGRRDDRYDNRDGRRDDRYDNRDGRGSDTTRPTWSQPGRNIPVQPQPERNDGRGWDGNRNGGERTRQPGVQPTRPQPDSLRPQVEAGRTQPERNGGRGWDGNRGNRAGGEQARDPSAQPGRPQPERSRPEQPQPTERSDAQRSARGEARVEREE